MLLILAGVALNTITGKESIINNANEAVGKYNNKVDEEKELLNTIEKYLIEHSKDGDDDNTPPPTTLTPLEGPASVDSNGLATEDTLIKPDANSNLQIVIPEGFAPAILTGSNSTTSLPGQDGSVASILAADQWENITTEQINKGIVIVDHAITYDGGATTGTVPDFNEYVWVPIPESSDFDREAWTTRYGYNSSGDWGDGGDTGRIHLLANASTQYYYWEETTTTEYTNMVSSVNTHKGFYIGRYEASKDSTETIAQSKRGQAAWTYISQTNSINACTSNTSTNNMQLMYGIEWDSTLNWLNNNAIIASSTAGQTKTMDLADIQTNSTTWGNYNNSTGDAASTPWEQSTEQNTGASEYWKANNIYDLAGNIYEWTQEKYSTGGSRALRGGNYYGDGDYSPVAYRNDNDASNTVSGIRFPYQLLLVALTSGMKNYNK